MSTLLNKWFIAEVLIWVVIIISRKFFQPVPFINGYIDDAVAIPVIANLGLWFQRVFVIGNSYYVLSAWHVIFIVVYVALLFEWFLPSLSKTYTADWRDVLLYILGGLFFYLVMNKAVAEERERYDNI